MTKFYVDVDGVYLGGFDGVAPLIGAIEVSVPPGDAREIWDGQAWSLPLALLRDDLRSKINEIRDLRIRDGLHYSFPDGLSGTIESAVQRDFDSLQALTILAQELRATGETEAVLTFVDKEDQAHSLAPDQMIEVGVALTQHVASIYSASWAHKQAVKEAGSTAALKALDLQSGWP